MMMPRRVLFTSVFVLAFCVLISFLFSVSVQGQETNPPVVTSLTIATSSLGGAVSAIDLTENSTTTVYIHGTASDADSCQQIDAAHASSVWQVALYRSDVDGAEACTPDGQNCYQANETNANITDCENLGDTTLSYEMQIPVQHYADATDTGSVPDHETTDWTASVMVTDDNELTGSLTSTVEINSLKALHVSTSVVYGSLDLDSVSEEQSITITNTGNDGDLDPKGNDSSGWTCSSGGFGPGQVTMNTVPAQGWDMGVPLTASPEDLGDLSIPKSSDTATSTGTLYLTLKIPPTGAGGTCTGSLTIGAG